MPARLDLRADADADLSEIVRHLRRGGLVAYPTETVYGVGGTLDPAALDALRRLKGRDVEKPFLVLVDSAEAVRELEWTPAARELASTFWPGPLTLVLADPLGIFPGGVRDSVTGGVGVRVSPHPVVGRLVRELGGPLTSTSLNASGSPPARSGTDALEVLRHLGGDEVWVLDGGTLPEAAPSTVVDCTGAVPRVLRPGTVPTERLRCAIAEIQGE